MLQGESQNAEYSELPSEKYVTTPELDARQKFQDRLREARSLESKGMSERAGLVYQLLTAEFPDEFLPYHRLAVFYMDRYEDNKAFSMFEEAYRRQPDTAEFYHDFSRFLGSLDQWDRSLAMSVKAIKLDPQTPTWREQYATCLARTGDFNAALEEFVKVSDDRAAAYVKLGNTQFAMRDYPHAEATADAALKLVPNYAPALRLKEKIEEKKPSP